MFSARIRGTAIVGQPWRAQAAKLPRRRRVFRAALALAGVGAVELPYLRGLPSLVAEVAGQGRRQQDRAEREGAEGFSRQFVVPDKLLTERSESCSTPTRRRLDRRDSGG